MLSLRAFVPVAGLCLSFCLAGLPASLDAQEIRGDLRDAPVVEEEAPSERAEEQELFMTLGQETLDNAPFKDLKSPRLNPPNPEEIGRCIVLRYQSEPEVGYSYAIAQNGNVAASGAGGFARAPWEAVSPGVSMQDTTRMTLASVSKPITALAVMKLLDETSVELDDPFYPLIADDYDGWWFDSNGLLMFVPHPDVTTVTIRNLLTHRSGLKPGLGCGKIPESLASSLAGTPGVTYDYENANFCILRKVVEAVSGMDFLDYLQTKIFTPAGLFNVNCSPDALAPALYYNTIGSAGKSWGDYSASCSAYGMYASAVDLAQLLGQLRMGAILDSGDVTTMLGNCPNTDTNGYCLGWQRASSAAMGGDYFGHSGDWIAKGCGGDCNRGLNSTIRRYPLGIDAAILVNTRSGAGGNPTLTSEASILNSCYAEALAAANP